MPLIDDIEFYGRAVDAGELEPARAAALLQEAHPGRFSTDRALDALETWQTARADRQRDLADLHFALFGLEHGLPLQDWARNRLRESGEADAARMLRRARREQESEA
ncbi:hypothetical protein [Streptomyces sp. NPDC001205]